MATKSKKKSSRNDRVRAEEGSERDTIKKRGEGQKRRFRVLAGTHTLAGTFDQETQTYTPGKMFRAGQVFESDLPLHTMFVNKFEPVGSRSRDELPPGEIVRMRMEDDIDTNDDIMDDTPQDDGHLIDPDSPQNARRAGRAVAMQEEDDEEAAFEEKYGRDVSEKYATADEAGLKVYRNGDRYHVFDADDLESPLSPRKGLKKEKLKAFVAKYVESNDASDEEDEE